jgi:hypothetical protein
MEKVGWRRVYYQNMTIPLKWNDLQEILGQCREETKICVGGLHRSNCDKLILCAVDNATDALKETFSSKEAS